ncbi:hypothetical protein KIN20_030582 [Parelaphostrongylus tenuis]|uniref:Uncharacterized protein n=1 Tax=Parelaphostrongylus tenuis TaxID=148309 RepID=A0AAD5R3X2_PARTN|nr:hypothetical protein KIN20_030582 [Parelaphostrongylus tenuis]
MIARAHLDKGIKEKRLSKARRMICLIDVHRPTQLPPESPSEQILRKDLEYGGGETDLLKDAQSRRLTTKKILSNTSTTRHHPRHISFLKWTPANCSNPRDCCLNCLFFFVAPLVVLLIIIAIIITLVVG